MCKLPNGVISNDLEWLSDSDVERRATSLRKWAFFVNSKRRPGSRGLTANEQRCHNAENAECTSLSAVHSGQVTSLSLRSLLLFAGIVALIFAARCYTWRRVCCRKMSVRLSVTHRSSVEIYGWIKLFHRRVATPFKFFSVPNVIAIFRRVYPPNRGIECRGYEKTPFSTIILLYLGNDTI